MKMNMKTIVASAMILATACSGTAFAEDIAKEKVREQLITGNEEVAEKVIAVKDVKENAKEDAKEDAKEEVPAYIQKAGKIEKITKEEGSTRVEIGEQTDGLVMNLLDSTMVLNRKTNEFISVAELKEGMQVCAVIPANAPMTMSLPPMTSSVAVLVANVDAGNVAVGKFDKDLINAEAKLKLNIDEKTIISDATGIKKVFTAEDVKEQNALVFYDATTKSIPAQTTPSRVLILAKEEVDHGIDEKTEVALREVAEKAGFKVTWVANDKPVLVEKEGLKIEVTLGAKAYVKNGEKLNAIAPVGMKDDKMIVFGDIANLLK